MPIETRDILVADCTIIAGVLILLSVTITVENPLQVAVTTAGLAGIGLGSVAVFSFSAIQALREKTEQAKGWAFVGFATLIVSFGFIILGLALAKPA